MQTRAVPFTIKYSGRVNVLRSDAYIYQPLDPTSSPHPPRPEDIGAKKFVAVWDTGATNCVITQRVADECGLKPTGMVIMHTVNGDALTPTYLASIFLPNKVVIPELRVTRGIIAGDAEVLIGMDIIAGGDFAVTNKDGKTTFSFRVPSIECIDFVTKDRKTVDLLPPRALRKVGRNDPCLCGSGKKYKNCCGR